MRGSPAKKSRIFAALELERREGKKSYMNGGNFFGSLIIGEIDVLGASAQAQPNGFGVSSAERCWADTGERYWDIRILTDIIWICRCSPHYPKKPMVLSFAF
jgi:hypothetical protein